MKKDCGGEKTGGKTGKKRKKRKRKTKIVATTSLPAVDCPNADGSNAIRHTLMPKRKN